MTDDTRSRLTAWLETLGCEVTGDDDHRTLFHATVKHQGEVTVFERASESPRLRGWSAKARQVEIFGRFRDAGFEIRMSNRRVGGRPVRVHWLVGVWQRSKRLRSQ